MFITDCGSFQFHQPTSVATFCELQVGFLISLDKRQHDYDEETNNFVGLPQDFNCVFIQENDAFFKNVDMAQLDEELGDLDAFIKDTESMIVSELEDDILDCETDLRATFGALADLDCILSFASCAADLDFVRPNVVDASEKKISIANGRHPLQERIIDTEFIPNDTHVDARCRVNVITGPNFSGKSCYTRQVGMLVYMAHIGSFLPCDSATISITDQILARINTVETCAVPQSSFQLDLTQMGTILRRSTPYSLVLIDEFGKGKHCDNVRMKHSRSFCN
jgi:DNA mismatch repair protein MSH5